MERTKGWLPSVGHGRLLNGLVSQTVSKKSKGMRVGLVEGQFPFIKMIPALLSTRPWKNAMWLWKKASVSRQRAGRQNITHSVIGRVEILSVPARREEDVGTDTSRAFLIREVDGVISANTRGRAV